MNQTAIAAFNVVVQRAERSVHLLEGLRTSLVALGKLDLVPIVDLISDDARLARDAIQRAQEQDRRRTDKRIVQDLKSLVRLGGAAAVPIALSLARRVVNR